MARCDRVLFTFIHWAPRWLPVFSVVIPLPFGYEWALFCRYSASILALWALCIGSSPVQHGGDCDYLRTPGPYGDYLMCTEDPGYCHLTAQCSPFTGSNL